MLGDSPCINLLNDNNSDSHTVIRHLLNIIIINLRHRQSLNVKYLMRKLHSARHNVTSNNYNT